jgi:repressor LexA
MEFGERLKELRERAGLSQDALASELNKSKSLISMYESGKRIPPYETQELIADFFNVGLDYLMGRENVYLTLNTSKPQRIPVLGSVPAGIPLEAIEDIVDYEEIPESMSRSGEFFGLRVNGESMVPVFNDGDTVIIGEIEFDFID